ncbi:hypothetical protein UFOVP961_118 [uncultured Caudovirales phage]|uniref:Uncharacterized protein n=1 Tax=uncultured Caudovirales phage TaxID=2100421 RepID=A0A6J5QL07_9CAUD|nr:hypothetical protein UFOVP961_118 [uncultured Caudovirales phage]CAB4185290.1 hypothetical protein UFOVP1123_46 [uncultured Caudovirales phage]CAB4193555.1 hypothetical protein UFOVP1239_104 [uncultured Caudovirales phage]CAB4215965.1 hypothetical protein UFOVP1484_50 [uncultured Caudovirales phage]CAB5230684.1 hypothetical protein UFOVP1577_56 [uncultured Caudovirales phage]
MIDPFTAFAMAQGAVKGIKAAIQLGKDVNGLMGDFGKFFEAADSVHIASTHLRIKAAHKSDAQIGAEAIKIAMASKTLRDNERQLKDMLIMSGNGDVWEEMSKERVRMFKERAAALVEEAKLKKERTENMLNSIFTTIILIGVLSVVVPAALIGFKILYPEY